MKKPATYEEFTELLDADIKELMEEARRFILNSIPGIEENIKWGVPFYSSLGNICYLNTTKSKEHLLEIGFYRGKELSNEQGILEGDTKLIKKVFIKDKKDFSRKKKQFNEVLQEALTLNEAGPLKMPKPRKKYI